MLAASDSAVASIVTHCASWDDALRRIVTWSGAIAAATMLGTAMAAGDSTTQLCIVRSS